MPSPSQPITAAALDRMLAFLAPFFLAAAEGNLAAARRAAAETLQPYAARTEPELRLAAQIIAFSFRALDALARAAAPELGISAMLRLHSSAIALNRAVMRCQKELDKLQAQPLPQDHIPAAEPPELLAFADATRRALAAPPAEATTPEPAPSPNLVPSADPVTEAVPAAAPSPTHAPRLSRQQRRLAERLAERERRRQQDRTRPNQTYPDQTYQVERTLLSLTELEAAL